MFKLEKLLLFLLICVCLVVTVVLLDAVLDPSHFISTVYARLNDTVEPVQDEIYLPDLDEGEVEILPEVVDNGDVLDAVEEISVLVEAGWDVFRSKGFAFEIQFPKEIVQKSILNQDVINSGIGLAPEAPVWQFRVDNPVYYQGTNLIDASLFIHVLEGEAQEEACLAFKQGSIYQTPNHKRDSLISIDINGIPFSRDEVLEGGMGEFFHRISYRTFTKGACYELTQMLQYRNLAGQVGTEVTEFDQEAVINELDQVMSTFIFLDVEPTFPEQSYPVPKTMSTAVSKSASEYVDGLDVSHWQGTINWNQVADAGYVFTFAKGTEGVGWTDVKFHENMEGGNDAGVMMGVYHFARPNFGNTGEEEADYFLSVAGDYLKSGYLRPVLDLEVGSSLGKTALTNWVLEWMETVKNRTGIEPLLYTNLNFINYYLTEAITEYDLWIAYWTCEPEPSYDIPRTGSYRDWAFWQYYGPGGCGGNAGYVPGISTNIDLNIFNGVEEGLAEYDSASHLFVSLTSDSYFEPVPYYADMTGNVNGDTVGLINFAFWWDCAALEADISLVEGTCGVLPVPPVGECAKDEIGQQCLDVNNEIRLAEHTYSEIGDYTPKVIVERGGAAPAEDRYKISTYNPIRYFTADPVSPAEGDTNLGLEISGIVDIHTTLEGVLQVDLADPVSGEVFISDCMTVNHDDKTQKPYSLNLNETDSGQVVYQISARYRARGDCPVEDTHENDIPVIYIVDWVNDSPMLEITDENGNLLLSGTTVDIGEVEPSQTIVLNFEISNPSQTIDFEVAGVVFDNLVNVSNLLLTPEVPYTVGPGEVVPVSMSFDILTTGPISFEVGVDHNAINPSPFSFTIEGTARLASNPILSINSVPESPGQTPVNDPYGLQINVELNAPAEGVLGVSILNSEGTSVDNAICLNINSAGLAAHNFDFSWTETEVRIQDYTIWARYRMLGGCPIIDAQIDDLSQAYQIDWQGDNPVLEIQDSANNVIPDGGTVNLGDLEAFQTINGEFLILNTSETSFLVTDVTFEGLVNAINPQVDPPASFNVGPGEQVTMTGSFEIQSLGDFSLKAVMNHTASNPTPFSFTLQGRGVLTQNPLLSISPAPATPGHNLINQPYDLEVEVNIDPPVSGTLKVELINGAGISFEESDCLVITSTDAVSKTANFSWITEDPGVENYTIRARYYVEDSCQTGGSHISELTMDYQVEWQEESPVLELRDLDGNLLPDGGTVNLGQFEYYQDLIFAYQLPNTSTTNSLSITGLSVKNLANLTQVSLDPAGQAEIAPGGSLNLEIAFLVDHTGAFSFDLVIDHQGSNPTPYRVTFQGSGVMTDNPLKFVVPMPTSPSTSLIGDPFTLRVDVGIDAPDTGSLQVSLIEAGSELISSQECLILDDNLNQARTLNLSWTRSIPGNQEYTLWTRYRAQGECPIEDTNELDLSQSYSVNWEEDYPVLEVRDRTDALISQGRILDLGQKQFYQAVEILYTLVNTSTTSNLEISSINVENLINLNQVNITPGGPITLGPESEQELAISFLVTEQGLFGFDLIINHKAANPSPYRIGFTGNGVMVNNPILSLEAVPGSPGSFLVTEPYQLQIISKLDPPAPGILEISLEDQNLEMVTAPVCLEIPAGELAEYTAEFSWEESESGDQDYLVRALYQADASCPLEGTPDAELIEPYRVKWQILSPVLIVNRPEGVTIFDGAVDYVGEHDFFRFVEVTYVIDNDPDASTLIVDNILVENLENLREVLIDPALPFEVKPGESQVVKINFQVLMLEPFSFDLVWEHNGSNSSPYLTGIQGDAKLNLGEVPVESWLYKFLDNLIRSGFFLTLPIFGLFVLRRKKV